MTGKFVHCAAHTSAGMMIAKDVRDYAAKKEIDQQAALGVGMKEKSEEFIFCRC